MSDNGSIEDNKEGNMDNIIKDTDSMKEATSNGVFMSTLLGHTSFICCMISICQNQIASASQDKTIKIWDITVGNCLNTLVGHNEIVLSLIKLNKQTELTKTTKTTESSKQTEQTEQTKATERNEILIASISNDKSVKIWNTLSGSCLATLLGHTDTIRCLRKLNNKQIVTGGWDKTIKIWDVYSKECIKMLDEHKDIIFQVITVGNKIVSSSQDKTIKIWDVSTGKCLKTISCDTYVVNGLLKLNERQIATGSAENNIKILDLF